MAGFQDPNTLHVAPPLDLLTSGYPQHPTLMEYTMVPFFLGDEWKTHNDVIVSLLISKQTYPDILKGHKECPQSTKGITTS